MYRASTYNIYVDLPENEKDVLLIHGYTGAYDRVSRRVASYVRGLSGNKKIEGRGGTPQQQTIETLLRRGYLTEKSPEEEEAFFCRFAELLHRSSTQRMPGYVFMPTYDCNLRCHYCFQAHMRTEDAPKSLLRAMSPQAIDRIFAALPGIEAKHGFSPETGRPVPRRSVLFFGGEPLLARSRPAVEHIMRRAREMGPVVFSAISNGTELDSYEDLIGPGEIESFQITLDGPRDEHDQRRIYADGGASFDRIADNISMVLSRGAKVSIRMNIDHGNIHQLALLAEQIIDRGWSKQKGFSAYVAPIHSNEANPGGGGSEIMDSWVLTKMLTEEIAKFPAAGFIGRMDDSLLSRLRSIFDQQGDPTPGFKANFCGAHSTMYLFDAFCDVFACWEHTGSVDERIGHISVDGTFEPAEKENDRWRGRTVTTNAGCRRCRYAFYCGGGCASLAEHHRGEFYSSFCDGFSRRFSSAAATAYSEHLAGKAARPIEEDTCRQ